ncbi:MAG: hypothetical protein ABSD85_10225 [Acidimicrobiales bacterium]
MSAALTRWFGQPALDTTGLRWTRPASHMQHGVARSGLFYMSEETLGFVPRRIDALFGARAVSFELATLTDIQLKPTLRKLRVTVVTDNGRDRFIVADAVVVYQDLQSWQLR